MTLGTDSTTASASRRRRLVLVAAVIALCAVAAAALWPRDDATPRAATDTTATPRTTAPTTSPPSPSPTTSAAPSPGAPIAVRMDAVDLDATVLPTASVDGRFDPPTLHEAYWIEAYGAPGPGSDNTVYLLGHSWDNGDAVFNALFDRASQTSRVQPGDEIVVTTAAGDVTYEVDRTERYPRASLADSDVWKVVPGRLVLITCFQTNDGADARDNFVVYAQVAA